MRQASGGDNRPQSDGPKLSDVDYSWKANAEKYKSIPGMTVFEIESFSRLAERHNPPTFTACGHEWQILIVPNGNSNESAVSVFLGMPPTCTDVPRNTRFQLSVIDQNDIRNSIFKESNHNFPSSTNDWGFNKLIMHADLKDKSRAFLLNDTFILGVFIKVTPPITKDIGTYSRRDTGFVGLKNQGATCYMNSLLQSYFHISEFTRLLYSMRTLPPKQPESTNPDTNTVTEGENQDNKTPSQPTAVQTTADEPMNNKKNLCLALQRVFFNLQHSETAVETRDLTTSFGWDSYEAFQQHDVQELNAVLIDKLQEKAKSCKLEGKLEDLLEGQILKYIKCIDVNYESSRKEKCLELQLSVKGSPDIMSSFRKYCDEERLDGDNKYNAEGHGLQAALMGTKFVKLPPVLQLHLVRYEYDPNADATVKINDRFEFTETLDLNEFMAEKSDINYTYLLHSVLVHSGDVHGGHYFAFIRPTDPTQGSRSQWFRFDDDVVTYATPKEAIEDNFGGDDQSSWRPPFPIDYKPTTIKRFSSAYMLVYVRKDDAEKLLQPIKSEHIPTELVTLFEQENKAEAKTRQEKEESYLYTTVHVFSNEHFQAHKGLDVPSITSPHLELRVKKSDTFGTLKTLLCERMSGVNYQELHLYSMAPRRNGGLRVDRLVRDDSDYLPNPYGSELMFFVDVVTTPANVPEILLFAKLFDRENQELISLGSMRCATTNTLNEVMEKAVQMMPSTYSSGPFLVYEEKMQQANELTSLEATVGSVHLLDGDILIFHTNNQPPISQRTTETPLYQTVPEYVSYLSRRVVVTFKYAPELEEALSLTFPDGRTQMPSTAPKPDVSSFDLVLSGDMRYDDVALKVAAQLSVSHLRIRFRTQNAYTKQPYTALHRKSATTLDQMLNLNRTRVDTTSVLYFDLLDHDITDLDSHVVFTLQMCSLDCKLSSKGRFLVPEKMKVEKLLALAEKRFVTDPASAVEFGDCKDYAAIQLVEVEQHKILRIVPSSTSCQELGVYTTFRADLVHQSLKPLLTKTWSNFIGMKKPKQQMVPVFHFSMIHANFVEAHGVPFHMAVANDWTAARFKEEVARRLGLSRDEVMQWKVAVVALNKQNYIDDEANVLDSDLSDLRGLGLQHANTDTTDRHSEKAIRIKS